jgi:hypothetical protein
MTLKETTVACAALLFAGTFLAAPCHAQSNPADDDEARIADIVTASHILANEGILDSFGHISARSAKNPEHFFIPRAMAPALVTRADIVEVGLDCKPVTPNAPRLNGGRSVRAATIRTIYTHINAQAQSAALALSSKITSLNESELEINSTENFDADRPWQNYLQRLSAKR